MLIMAEVTSEMGAELRASALAAGTSVAAEVGRRLERLDRLEATVEAGSKVDGLGSVHPVHYRFAGQPAEESLYSGSPNPWDMFRNKVGGR
jgi:hypothetical protein